LLQSWISLRLQLHRNPLPLIYSPTLQLCLDKLRSPSCIDTELQGLRVKRVGLRVYNRFQKGTFCKCHLETPSQVFDTSHSAYRPWDKYLKFQKFLKIGPSPIHNNSLLQCYLENKCRTSSSNGSLSLWLFSLFITIGVDNHPPSFPDHASKIPVSLSSLSFSSPSYFSFTLYS
jgi:hypothetical protein